MSTNTSEQFSKSYPYTVCFQGPCRKLFGSVQTARSAVRRTRSCATLHRVLINFSDELRRALTRPVFYGIIIPWRSQKHSRRLSENRGFPFSHWRKPREYIAQH